MDLAESTELRFFVRTGRLAKLNNKSKSFDDNNKSNTSLAAPGALAHRLQRRTACNAAPPAKFKMAVSGPQNGRRGLERCLPPRFLDILTNFR